MHRVLPITLAVLVALSLAAGAVAQDDLGIGKQKLPPGQKDLDKATEVHFDATNTSDYGRVIDLCKTALSKGLDESGTVFAKELLGTTLFRRASITARNAQRGAVNPGQILNSLNSALTELSDAVEFKPDLTDAYILICQITELTEGDREQGFKAADAAIKILERTNDKPKLAMAYQWRAQYGDDIEAQKADFRKAIAVDEGNPGLMLEQGEFLHNNSQFKDAVGVFRKMLEATPEDAKLRLALAESLARTGEEGLDEAILEIDEVIKQAPKMTGAYRIRAQIYAEKKELSKAIADLSEAIKIDRNDIQALLFRAELYFFDKDLVKARDDVEMSLRRRPNLFYGLQLRSRISAAEGKFEEAMEDINVLVANDPENPDHRLQLAAYMNANDQPRAAIREIGKVLKADPENWRAMRARADAYLSVGNHSAAVTDYEMSLKALPEDSGILNNYAWVLATSTDDDVRDADRAISLATKACELTDYKAAHILSTLASGYAEKGDFETAIKWSTKAVELSDEDMVEQLKSELKSYEEKKPWREKQIVEEKKSESRPDLIET